jgi:two-component sensor histidine kinase
LSKSPRKSSPPASRLDGTREIHHRVKNNLQIIASILRLQMRREASISAQTALGGAITRIMGMVQVHDLLSQKPVSRVDLRELLERLLDLNVQAFMMPGQAIRPRVSGRSVVVDADKGLSIALAANELIVNALKHAFSGRREGRLEASVSAAGREVTVAVADDGAGLPEGFTLAGSSNLGLRLVQSVVRDDLKGDFALAPGARGARAVLRFRR